MPFAADRNHLRVPYLTPMIEEAIAALEARHWDKGATLSLEDAVDYARRRRGARGRPLAGWDSLTPAEEKVVALVADGLSNQEIADSLFVSLATVKTHLTHVFRKLDLRNRTQLVNTRTNEGVRALLTGLLTEAARSASGSSVAAAHGSRRTPSRWWSCSRGRPSVSRLPGRPVARAIRGPCR